MPGSQSFPEGGGDGMKGFTICLLPKEQGGYIKEVHFFGYIPKIDARDFEEKLLNYFHQSDYFSGSNVNH